jgi:hypothetical protein
LKHIPSTRQLLLFLISLFGLALLHSQNIIYVNKNVATSGNGSSWNTAFKELSQALSVATSGKEIWVAKGIYAPTYCTNCIGQKDATFAIQDGIKLYGGFAGYETNVSQRNRSTNLTILSGCTDPLAKTGNYNSHVYNIMTLINVSANTTIDGFIFTGARAVNTAAAFGELGTSGGAIIIEGKSKGNANPVISNCLFYDNYVIGFGGAIFTNGSFDGNASPTIFNCIFTNNLSDKEGGAINNQGIYKGNCSPKVTFCTMENNQSHASGGGIYNNGVEGNCNPIFENCKVINNSVNDYGGGVYSIGKMGTCIPQYTNMLFYKNKAYSAGAIYSLGSLGGNCSPIITNCVIYGNMANTGGGIYSNASDSTGTARPIITNTIIYNNVAGNGPIFRNILGTPQLSYSIVNAANCIGLQSGTGSGTNCLSNVYYNIDPNFIDPTAGNFHFLDNSSVLNKGTNASVTLTKDILNQNRINDGTVDLGIYESNNPTKLEILLNPQSDTVCKGGKAIFNVSAFGNNLKYKWVTNIPYTSTDNLPTFTFDVPDSVPNVNFIYCIVSSGTDTVYSGMASLKLKGNTFTRNTITASAMPPYCAGDVITFFNSKTNLTQNTWFLNNVAVGNQSTYVLTIPNANFQIKSTSTSPNSCSGFTIEDIINDYTVTKLDTIQYSIVQNPLPFCTLGNATLKMQVNKTNLVNGYEWRADNAVISTNNSIQVTVANISQKITCKLNAVGCIFNKDNLLANYQMLVFNPSAPILSFNTKDTLCLNKKVTYTLRSNFNSNDTISWYYNGNFVKKSNDSTLVINAIKSFDSIRAVVVPNTVSCKTSGTISLKFPMLDVCVATTDLSNIRKYYIDAQDALHVQFEGNERIHKVVLYDVLGRILGSEEQEILTDSYTFKLPKTESGIKFVSIKTDEKIYDLKIYH